MNATADSAVGADGDRPTGRERGNPSTQAMGSATDREKGLKTGPVMGRQPDREIGRGDGPPGGGGGYGQNRGRSLRMRDLR